MLGLFRKNLFINFAILFLFTVVLRGYCFFVEGPTPESWQLESIFNFYDAFPSRFLQILLSIILIFSQAFLISRYVIEHRLSRVLSLIPGAIFVLFAATILESHSFSTILFANLFFVIGLGNLFRVYKKFKPIGTIFNAGFFLGIASLIYFPYFMFFLSIIMGLFSLRAVNLKEFIQLLSGYLGAFFLAGIYLYYHDNFGLIGDMLAFNFSTPSFDLSNPQQYLKLALLIVCVIVIFFYQNSIRKKKKFDAIKKIELTYWQLIFGTLLLFFTNLGSEEYMLILSAPFAILAGLIMESRDGYIVKEFLFILMLVLGGLFTLNVI